MRKFLSLVLALVMMMSLVTINVGAKEFTDGDDITYQEAVDVISTIHVVDGYNDGDFKPGNNLSRGAAAKIICNMILGPTTAAELHADTAPYRDVPVTSDFAGYIAYCQKEGIISGYADGTFRPAGTLTGYAFMKMLLGALGYDAEIEGYTGPNWSINVAKRAIGIGLNASLEKTFNGVDFVTREEAALYAFNTLRADLVEYSSKITATVNGAEVTVGNSNATPQEWGSQMTRRNNIYPDPYVQFAEQYFNKLVLTEAMDCFGRPDREWKYDGDEIGAYINMDFFKEEYTTEVTGKQLRDLLGGTVIDDYHFEIHVDGIDALRDAATLDSNEQGDVFHFSQGNMIRTNTKGVGGTGDGVLTQVFVDNDNDNPTVWVSVINTYLAKATDDYDEKKEEAEFEVYSLEDVDKTSASITLVKNTNDSDFTKPGHVGKAGKQPYTEDLTVKNEDINVEDIKDKDIVLVRVADGEIKEILDPEVISDTEISSFKNGDWVKAEEQYDYADSATYDPEVLDEYDDNNMKDTTYNLYLDPYGYLIGIEIVEAKTNYAFLTGIDGKTSNLANKTAEGNVILLDGTMDTVTIKLNDSEYADGCKMTTTIHDTVSSPQHHHELNSLMNTWCKYTTNKNGDYVLTEVAKTGAQFDADKNKSGQSHVSDVTTGHDDEDFAYNTIDKKHVSTPGIADSTVKMAYGTDDSIYLTVTTGLITATRVADTIAGPNPAFIIDDVDSVTVGVQTANLRAFTASEILDAANDKGGISDTTGDGTTIKQLDSIANGVYNLFDDDGAIIAAVVVGEDSGSTTNYAYTISNNVKQESYSKDNEEWTWSREVIVNGEVVDVTEVGDRNPDIADMVRGQWYEMKYKADGTVKSATLIAWDETRDNDSTNDVPTPSVPTVGEFWADADAAGNKFVGLVRKVEDSVENHDTVVLCTDLTNENPDADGVSVPKYNTTAADSYWSINPDVYWSNTSTIPVGIYDITTTGNTLWIENAVTDQKDGFAVRNDAKIVLLQDTHVIRNGQVIKTNVMDNVYTYSQTGKEALAKMVKDLVKNDQFAGFISAVFDGGVATSVVVWDQTPEDINTGDDIVNPVDPTTTTVHLQYIDSSTMQQINVGKTVEKMSAGQEIVGDELDGYICQVADRKVTVPSFQEGTTELTLTLLYDPIATGVRKTTDSKTDASLAPGGGFTAGGGKDADEVAEDAVKDLDDGVFDYTDEIDSASPDADDKLHIADDITNKSDVKLFKFTAVAGERYTLIITGDATYEETITVGAAGDSAYFYIQLLKTTAADGFWNSGTGSLASAPLTTGQTISYKIVGQTTHQVVLYGTYTA